MQSLLFVAVFVTQADVFISSSDFSMIYFCVIFRMDVILYSISTYIKLSWIYQYIIYNAFIYVCQDDTHKCYLKVYLNLTHNDNDKKTII